MADARMRKLASARAALASAEAKTGLRTRLRVVGGAGAPTDPPGAPSPDDDAPSAVPAPPAVAPGGDLEHLPVPDALRSLLPHGLPRGTVTRVTGSAALLLALAGAACGEEGWAVLTAMPDVGWRAASAAGLPLDRVVVVPDPGPGAPAVLGALVDGVDVLLMGKCPAMAPRDRRALLSRLRRRGSVLITSDHWEGADTVLSVHGRSWRGLATGFGVLTDQEVEVRLGGRRGAAAGGSTTVLLGAGGVAPARRAEPARSGVVEAERQAEGEQQQEPASAAGGRAGTWARPTLAAVGA